MKIIEPGVSALLSDLSSTDRMRFEVFYEARRKNPRSALLLALLLGGCGAHHFYLGRTGLGVLYILFCWTFVPMLVSLVECFFMSGRVRKHNVELASRIASEIESSR